MANVGEEEFPRDEEELSQNGSENEEDQNENEEQNEDEDEYQGENEADTMERLAEDLIAIDKSKEQKPTTVRKRLRVTKQKGKVLTKFQTRDEINDFFEGREKNTTAYRYTPEGNLEIKGVEGKPDTIIRMDRRFRKITPAQYEEYKVEQTNQLMEAEKTYELTLQSLRLALDIYEADQDSSNARGVVLANQAVARASALVCSTAYPERWTKKLESVETRQVLMNYEKFEKRKLRYPIYLFKHYDINGTKAWGTYEQGNVEEEEQEGGGLRIRFITDVEDKSTGHFHPFYTRNVVYNETEYCCPYQAYQAERFKELGLEDLRKQILSTRSGRTMHVIALKDTTLPKTPQALWEDILFHYFHQNEDLAKELEQTGSDRFHVMDKQIPAEYGPALEKARHRMRELGDTEVEDQQVKERVITEEQQKKDKVGAIIHNFRKKF